MYTYSSPDPFAIAAIAVAVFAGLILLIGPIVTYNRLVNLRNTISESWSDVDTELRRRHDLIPNLVETVRGYAAHEREVFESIAEARSRAVSALESRGQVSQDESELVVCLKRLLAVAENYPDLKANQNFLHLQRELVNTEDRIQAARRFYNGNIREYNTLVQSFPSNIIAGIFGFSTNSYFQIEELVANAVSVAFQKTP